MIDVLDLHDPHAKISTSYEPDMVRIIKANYDKRHEWYTTTPSTVNSDHLICAIIRGMQISASPSDQCLLNVNAPKGIRVAGTKGISTINTPGHVLSNLFFKGPQIVIGITGSITDTPVKVLWHGSKDLSMPIMNLVPTAAVMPMIIISLAGLAKSVATRPDLTIPQYVSMVVLPEMVASYTNVSMFNIMTLPTLDLISYASSGKHPFFLMSESQFVKKVHSELNRRQRYRKIRLSRVVSSVPLLTPINQLFDVSQIPSQMQLYWFKAMLNLIIFLRFMSIPEDPYRQNRTIVGRFTNAATIVRKSGTVPDPLRHLFDTHLTELIQLKESK